MAKKAAKKAAKRPATKAPKKAAASSAARKGGNRMIEDVRELVDLMTAHDITEVNLEEGNKKILLRRGPAGTPVLSVGAPTVAPAPVASPAAAAAAPAASAPADAPAESVAVADGLIDIVSPMVGTFYSSPSPDSDAYVAVDSKINDESVICIVEAMKVMNEIKAECSGTVVEICVKNAQPVEYGQVLYRVKPA